MHLSCALPRIRPTPALCGGTCAGARAGRPIGSLVARGQPVGVVEGIGELAGLSVSSMRAMNPNAAPWLENGMRVKWTSFAETPIIPVSL